MSNTNLIKVHLIKDKWALAFLLDDNNFLGLSPSMGVLSSFEYLWMVLVPEKMNVYFYVLHANLLQLSTKN